MKKEIKLDKRLILCELLSFLSLSFGILIYALSYKKILYIHLIRSFFPDFLWMLSFMLAITPLLMEVFSKHAILISALLCLLLSVLFELFQFLDILGGTGDILDIAVYFAADILSCIIIKFIYVRRKSK